MSENYDLIVVGAGPAGSASAYTAVESGISVLLLEEHPQIGIPLTCAEALSRSTIKGYLDFEPEWISTELSGSMIRGPDDDEFKIEYPNVGWIMNRKVFDPALAKRAISNGALVETSSRAIGIEDNEIIVDNSGEQKRYGFKFLIAADGIASNVGRWMGIDTRLNRNEIESCAEYVIENIEIDPRYAQLIFGDEYAPGGYAWIFPKSYNSANVGLGISLLKTKKHPKHFLDNLVKKEFPGGKIKERIYGCVPAKILKKFSGENFYLVGDAARFTDPLSGAGIANAIKSGVIAGRNAVLRLKGKRDYFEAEIKSEILKEITFHRKIRNVCLKLTDHDYREIFRIGKRIFEGNTIDNINSRRLVREILLSSPHLFGLGFSLLF
jgi:digeranylgeranylglycerophospholipid reductase